MRPFTSFIPSNSNSSGTIDTHGANTNEQLVIYNDSVFGLQLTFPDTSVDILPPGWGKDFIVKSVPMGKVTWTIINQVQATNYPLIEVYGTLYEPDEHRPSIDTSMQRGIAVTPTASGDPIFSATFGSVATASTVQALNVFNPANSGVNYYFHS